MAARKKAQVATEMDLSTKWVNAKKDEVRVEILRDTNLTMQECLKMILDVYDNVDTDLSPLVKNAVFENPNMPIWLSTTDSDGTKSAIFSQLAFIMCATPLALWYTQYALSDPNMLEKLFEFLIQQEFRSANPEFKDIWNLCGERLSGWKPNEKKNIAIRKFQYIGKDPFRHLNALDQLRGACRFWDESQEFLDRVGNFRFITKNMMKPLIIQNDWKPSFFNFVPITRR